MVEEGREMRVLGREENGEDGKEGVEKEEIDLEEGGKMREEKGVRSEEYNINKYM